MRTKFKTVIYGNIFIDEKLLYKGIYEQEYPWLIDPEFKSMDELIELTKSIYDLNDIELPESYIENLRKCKLVDIEIKIL